MANVNPLNPNNLNGYIAFFKDKRTELYAKDLWDAKQKAIAFFKAKKKQEWQVNVYLAEKNGETVVHTPDF